MTTDTNQPPAIIKLLATLAPNWAFANHILNYGCSEQPELTEQVIRNRFNQVMTVAHFDTSGKLEASDSVLTDFDAIQGRHFDVMLCADVLNTCRDLQTALNDLAKIDFDCCVIQIDEGNQSGKGRKSRRVYQRNEPTANYIEILQRNFHRFDVTLHRDKRCIVLNKGRKYYYLDDDGEE